MKPLCLHRFDSLGSTNDEAMRLVRAGAEEGTVVWAERQTAGRGRMGRSWESDAGNLSMSVIARPALAAALAGRLGVSCGLALAVSLAAVTGLPIRTKWPNDLYLHGRKVGGILVETRARAGGALDGAVVGIGINITTHPHVPPPGQSSTALGAHGFSGGVDELVGPLAVAALSACETASAPDWAERVFPAWAALDLAEGPVRVRDAGGEYDAVGERVDGDGALIIRRAGRPERVTAGEVSVRASTG